MAVKEKSVFVLIVFLFFSLMSLCLSFIFHNSISLPILFSPRSLKWRQSLLTEKKIKMLLSGILQNLQLWETFKKNLCQACLLKFKPPHLKKKKKNIFSKYRIFDLIFTFLWDTNNFSFSLVEAEMAGEN